MPRTLILRPGSDNDHELHGLLDTSDGTYPTDATVTVSLYRMDDLYPTGSPPRDEEATPVVDGIEMALVPGTSGAASIYRGTFSADTALLDGTRYTAITTAIDASGDRKSVV